MDFIIFAIFIRASFFKYWIYIGFNGIFYIKRFLGENSDKFNRKNANYTLTNVNF